MAPTEKGLQHCHCWREPNRRFSQHLPECHRFGQEHLRVRQQAALHSDPRDETFDDVAGCGAASTRATPGAANTDHVRQFQQGLRPHAETACGTAAERCCLPRTHAGQSIMPAGCSPLHTPRCSCRLLLATPKGLLAQTDSWICHVAHEHLKDFLQYDYVGSPWYMFLDILRDLEAMLNITKSFRPSGRPEELWFCSHLQSDAMRLSARRNTLPGRPTRHRRIRSRVLFCPRRP